MAAVNGWVMSGAVVLALSTGIPVGCGSDACATSCAGGGRGMDVIDLGEATRFELCVDETCYELRHDASSFGERWANEEVLLPAGESRFRVTAFGSDGTVVATLDETHTPPSEECCGPYLPLVFDGEDIDWVDQ